MCGIAASVSVDHRNAVETILAGISHRGPDDRGMLSDCDSQITVGMNRLSIIDIATGGQPVCNEDQSIWVVCNGEIFNSPELRRRLESKGHFFRSQNSDVEVIPHLYEEYGTELANHLDGMFSFILYDQRKKTLLAVRDRFGIKPLYYQTALGGITFASELKAILRLPGVTKKLDRQSLSNYLSFQFLPAPRTPFEGIFKLGAGQRLEYDLSRRTVDVITYWSLPIVPPSDQKSEPIEDLRRALDSAVTSWSLSDVPIAVSLSGGIDSAAIVAILAMSSNRPVRTFTLGFKNPLDGHYSELEAARLTALKWRTDHTEILVEPDRVIQDLPQMAYHLDEPYGGGLPSWYVYEAMRGKVKVCHTGTGADELFGNYGKASSFRCLGKNALRREIVKSVRNLSIDNLRYLWQFPNAYRSWMYVREIEKRRVFFDHTETLEGCLPSEHIVEKQYHNHPSDTIEDTIAAFDFENQLSEEFLHVTDRFSMAHGIEARVPFLDHHLVERVLRIPSSERVGYPLPKQMLREIVGPMVSPEILASGKRGFILPLTRWTRNELRASIEETFSPSFLKRQGLFNPDLHRLVFKPHVEGECDNTERVWTFFMFQQWYQVFMA